MKPVTNFSPITTETFHAVSADTVKQTIMESVLDLSCDMGEFVIHHGTRHGAPILIAEHKNQQADQLSGIWFAD